MSCKSAIEKSFFHRCLVFSFPEGNMWEAKASASLPLRRLRIAPTTAVFYGNVVDPRCCFTCTSSGKLAPLPSNIREAERNSFAPNGNDSTKYFSVQGCSFF